MTSNLPPITLPAPVSNLILEYSGVNRHGLFRIQGTLKTDTLYIALKMHTIEKLLLHIVRGEQHEAEEIIRNNPELLLEEGTVIDYSGRKIKGTALQMALGAGDISIWDNEERMVEMIVRYLKTMPYGLEIIAQQTMAQFPDDWEEKAKNEQQRDVEAVRLIMNVLNEDSLTQHLSIEMKNIALKNFRYYLEDKTKKIITTGRHFNMQMLVEACHRYDITYNPNEIDSYMLWCLVIGYIQRFLPACEAQAFCHGIYYFNYSGDWRYHLTSDIEVFGRSLNFMSDNHQYYPLETSNPELDMGMGSGLGFDHAAAFTSSKLDEFTCGRTYNDDLYGPFCEKKLLRLREFIRAAKENAPMPRMTFNKY